jgi:hypothetical protein
MVITIRGVYGAQAKKLKKKIEHRLFGKGPNCLSIRRHKVEINPAINVTPSIEILGTLKNETHIVDLVCVILCRVIEGSTSYSHHSAKVILPEPPTKKGAKKAGDPGH